MSIDEINKLTSEEKLSLIGKLWDSLNKEELEISDSQKKELERRIARYKSGETQFYSWEEVKERLKKSRKQ
jgi:putative addiction module component (TIGR02574 family)